MNPSENEAKGLLTLPKKRRVKKTKVKPTNKASLLPGNPFDDDDTETVYRTETRNDTETAYTYAYVNPLEGNPNGNGGNPFETTPVLSTKVPASKAPPTKYINPFEDLTAPPSRASSVKNKNPFEVGDDREKEAMLAKKKKQQLAEDQRKKKLLQQEEERKKKAQHEEALKKKLALEQEEKQAKQIQLLAADNKKERARLDEKSKREREARTTASVDNNQLTPKLVINGEPVTNTNISSILENRESHFLFWVEQYDHIFI